MTGLLWRTLLARPGRMLGPLVAFFLVSCVAAGSGILVESALRTDPMDGLFTKAAVVVTGQQHAAFSGERYESLQLPERVPVPGEVAHVLARLPGVADVIAYRPTPGLLVGPGHSGTPSREVTAEPWTMAGVSATGLADGVAPSEPGQVVLPRSLAGAWHVEVGDDVRLSTVGHSLLRVRVVGTTDHTPGQGLPVRVFLDEGTADRLAGSSTVEALVVTARDGTSDTELAARVRAAVAGTRVEVLDRAAGEQLASMDLLEARSTLVDIAGTFGGLALLVGLFVAISTLGLAVQQRTRETALLRALGATPVQVRRLVVLESLTVALLAAGLGCLAAPRIADVSLRSLVDHQVLPSFMSVRFSWIPVISAVGGVLAMAWLGALLASRRASRSRPADALRDSLVEREGIGRVRAGVGLVALTGAVVLSQVTMPGGGGAARASTASLVVLALMVAVGVLGPVLAAAGAVMLRPLTAAGPVGRLAAANNRAFSRRTASATTAVALVTALAGLAVIVPSLIAGATERQAQERTKADASVTSGVGGFTAEAVDRVGEVHGVATAVGLQRTSIVHGRVSTIDYPALVVTGGSVGEVFDLGITAGDVPRQWREGIVISDELADSWNVTVGDSPEVLLGDGTVVRPRVVATFTRSMGLADVLLPRTLAGGHISAPVSTMLLRVHGRPGDELRAAVQDATGDGTVQVAGRGRIAYAAQAETDLNAWLIRRLLGLVAALAAVAVVNTLLMVTMSRRGEFAALRLVGASRRQVRRMVVLETALLWLTGVVTGGGVAAVALAPLASDLGTGILAGSDVVAVAYIGVGLALLCLAATALGARLSVAAR